jgi:hypothetical protein
MNIDQSADNYIPEEEIPKTENNMENGYPNQGNEIHQNKLWDMITSETGEGSINSYTNHPLNKDNNKNISQIIRGFTGMLGKLNYSLLDILLGSMGFIKDKNDVTDYTVSSDQDIKDNVNNNYKNDISKKGPTIINGKDSV